MKELVDIQNELKVARSRVHPFIKNFKYWNVEDILENLKPLLKKYNCFVILTDDIVAVGDRLFVKAVATIRHEDKDEDKCDYEQAVAYAELRPKVERRADGKKENDPAQDTGSASTYARKYALNGLLAINDTQDADETAGNEPQPQPRQPKPVVIDQKMFDQLVAMEVNGQLTKKNEDPKEYFITRGKPNDTQLKMFDKNVQRTLIDLAARGEKCADGLFPRERFIKIYGTDKKMLDAFDTAVKMAQSPVPASEPTVAVPHPTSGQNPDPAPQYTSAAERPNDLFDEGGEDLPFS